MERGSKPLGQVRDRIRVKHYSISTQTQWVRWVRRFILFHGKRHPRDMGAGEVEALLSDRAVDGKTTMIVVSIGLSLLAWLFRCEACAGRIGVSHRHRPRCPPSRFA